MTILVVGAVFFSVVPNTNADSSLVDLTNRINDLVYNLSQSVVTVEAYSPSSRQAGDNSSSVYSLVSSGVICDSANRVLVVAQSVVDRELILIRNGDRLEPADVIGIDYRSGLAVLEADNYIGPPARFARNFTCAGQMVVAVGNSYGMPATPSIGFCAGLRNDGRMQFSAAVTSGSIGGALFDMGGRLVGLITGGLGPTECSDVGLAVPGYRLPDIVYYLVHHGNRRAGFLGVTATNMQISPPMEIQPPNQLISSRSVGKMIVDRGVMITSVVAASPAARGGLLPGDLVFSIDGQQLSSANQLVAVVLDLPPGRTVPIGILRNKQPVFLTVEIGHRQLDPVDGAVMPFAGDRVEEEPDDNDLRDELSHLKEQIRLLEERLERPDK